MKLSLSIIFCFIYIISSCFSQLPPFEGSKSRNFRAQPETDYHVLSENGAVYEQSNLPEIYRHHERINNFGSLEIEKGNFKRHQNYSVPASPFRLRLDEKNTKMEGIKVLRTYGRGKAQVTRQGQSVNVPNEYVRLVYKSTVAADDFEKSENEIKPLKQRGVCRLCPTDQKVVASKGNEFAILPEPCPINVRMWNHFSGPRPGSKIREGVHTIRGYIGPKKKFCQYNYQVIVRHCDLLKAKDDTTIKCSAGNSWGSICNASCANEKEPLGPSQLECKDDLTWSNPVPVCKSRTDCSTPKIKAKSKILCKAADMSDVNGDLLPNGTTCKFRQNEKEVSINCRNGKWRIIRKNKSALPKKEKQQEKTDACSPNPCQNGGTCLRSESNKEQLLCKCRPQTRGIYCEMKECYYNICENDGLCFIRNEERICYCTPEFSGDTCQYRRQQ